MASMKDQAAFLAMRAVRVTCPHGREVVNSRGLWYPPCCSVDDIERLVERAFHQAQPLEARTDWGRAIVDAVLERVPDGLAWVDEDEHLLVLRTTSGFDIQVFRDGTANAYLVRVQRLPAFVSLEDLAAAGQVAQAVMDALREVNHGLE